MSLWYAWFCEDHRHTPNNPWIQIGTLLVYEIENCPVCDKHMRLQVEVLDYNPNESKHD